MGSALMNWEEFCGKEERSLEKTLNFNGGRWGSSKMMFTGKSAAVTRLNVKTQSNTAKYNGVAFFPRKFCGADFLAKLADGTVQFDIVDRVGSYSNVHGFVKNEGMRSAFVVQWSNNALDGNEGSAKMDKLYISFIGLDKVNWGKKLMRQCLSRKIIVARMDYSELDHTPCLAWQRPVGN